MHAERGKPLMRGNFDVGRDGVNLRIRIQFPQTCKVRRAIHDKDCQPLRARCEEVEQLRPHSAKTPRCAQSRSISDVNAAR